MRSPVNIMYRWVLGAKDRAQKAVMRSLDKLHIGTPRSTEASTPGNSSGVPAGCVAWPVDPDTHDGAAFVAADCFLAYFDAKKKEAYLLDDADGTRHVGAKPLKLKVNLKVIGSQKRSGLGKVLRTAEYGSAGLYKNVFIPTSADLIAHHVDPTPPDNSSMVSDPDGASDRTGGLHYPLRVREWVRSFCTKYLDPRKLYAPLFNMGRNGDGTPAFGAAHWDRDEGVLSDEAGGPLATADDDNHILATTNEVTGNNINQGGIGINALYGPISPVTSSKGLYMPEELVVTGWEDGVKGPFVVRVEKRPDYKATHGNWCGDPAQGVIKWQSWGQLTEYKPVVPTPIVPTDKTTESGSGRIGGGGAGGGRAGGGPGAGGPGAGGGGGGGGGGAGGGPGGGNGPGIIVPADAALPSAATPAELESPSRYGHPAPHIPDGEPTRGNIEAPGNALPEHPQDLFWRNRYGYTEKDWNQFSNLCTHEFSLPVYESATRGTGDNPWPTKNNFRAGQIQFDARGNIIARDANMGNGTAIDAPVWTRPYHALLTHAHTWRESQHARIIMAGKNTAGTTVDGRTGLGARVPNSPFIASGIETKLVYDGDGGITTPDAHITGKTEAAAEDALGLSKLVINPRLKTTAGRERKTTDTSGNLTLDATHHAVNITGAHTVTLPATVVAGREYEIHNSSGGARTIARNGNPINGAASDFSLPDNARAFVSTEADAGGWLIVQATEAPGAGSGDMLAANNLSDVASAATARVNLGFLNSIKAADETDTTTTLQDDAHLAGLLTAGKTYIIEGFLTCTHVVGSGIKVALVGDGTISATNFRCQFENEEKASMTSGGRAEQTVIDGSAPLTTTLTNASYVYIRGSIVVNVGGTLKLQWSMGDSSGGKSAATTVQRGSWLKFTQVD